MLVLIRTIIYASVFSGIVLIVLPQQILRYVCLCVRIHRPGDTGSV
jgi:hypothetical protein